MAKRRKKKKKKSATIKWLIAIVFVFAVAAVAYVWYTYFRIERSKFVRYGAFGIAIPNGYQIHGIDVSRYQSFIHWPSVKQMKVKEIKIGFAFIKATEGIYSVDKLFRRNWKMAEETGMPRGAYHFFIPSRSGKAQAKNFTSTVKLAAGDLPPVLDIETIKGATPAKMRKEVQEWLDVVEDHYGVKPIIYTSVSYYTNYLGKDFDSYPLWVAHYKERLRPRIERPWIIWQHSEEGRVNGIKGKVDFNVFNGDSSDFRELLVE